MEIDLRQMITTGQNHQNVRVRNDDIVFVPRLSTPLPPLRLAPGSRLRFVLDPALLRMDGLEQLALLTEPQTVGHDGTIFVPYVGPVSWAGRRRRSRRSSRASIAR